MVLPHDACELAMNIVSKIRETFRDHTRDKLCAWLNNFLTAEMAERGRPEEKIATRVSSKGVIDISGSPVTWAHVENEGGENGSGRSISYGIPDSRVDLKYAKVNIRSIRLKDRPVIGKVIGLRWKGKDFDFGILTRLNNDLDLAKPTIDNHDLSITASPALACWLLTVPGRRFPSEAQWRCYESIARHLTA